MSRSRKLALLEQCLADIQQMYTIPAHPGQRREERAQRAAAFATGTLTRLGSEAAEAKKRWDAIRDENTVWARAEDLRQREDVWAAAQAAYEAVRRAEPVVGDLARMLRYWGQRDLAAKCAAAAREAQDISKPWRPQRHESRDIIRGNPLRPWERDGSENCPYCHHLLGQCDC